VDAFEQLGVNFRDDVTGELRNSNEVFAEVIDALGKMTNETERDAAAQNLLGKSARDLNPLIKAGSDEIARLTEEAEKTGAVMSDKAVQALDNFGETIEQVKQRVVAFVGEALAGLISSGNSVADINEEIAEKDKTLDLIDRYETLKEKIDDGSLSSIELQAAQKELEEVKQALIEASNGLINRDGGRIQKFNAQVGECQKAFVRRSGAS
jgi:hypothetical protein